MDQGCPETVLPVVLADKYRILEPLGAGGTSEVFLAEHIHLMNKWAVKRINEQHPMLDQTLHESMILKDLAHPMLPRVTDILKQDGYVYIVMDYLQGVTLRERLAETGPLSVGEIAQIGYQLTDVLRYLHMQNPPIIHRDIKPGNLLIDADEHIHLIDFGSARGYKEDKTDDTVYIGTKGYAAPEQFSLFQSDARTDIYSMGITLLVLLTGLSPLTSETTDLLVAAKRRKLPREMLQILEQCVQVMPSARPSGVEEVIPYFRETVLQNKGMYVVPTAKKPMIPQEEQQAMDKSEDASSEATTDWPMAKIANHFFVHTPRWILFGLLVALILYYLLRGLGWDIWPAFGWKVTGWIRDAFIFLRTNW